MISIFYGFSRKQYKNAVKRNQCWDQWQDWLVKHHVSIWRLGHFTGKLS